MPTLTNPHRPRGLDGLPSDLDVDPRPVLDLLERCPVAGPTPLVASTGIASALGVEAAWAKDERDRMGAGSFKALGAAYVVARQADEEGSLHGVTYAAASAGNHGLSLALGAAVFGARAVVFVSESVPPEFVRRLSNAGAEVVRAGQDYEASMAAATGEAEANGWRLLADSSWPGYTETPRRVMQGYSVMAHEIVDQLSSGSTPTHVLVQAGVGGLAAVVAEVVRARWGDDPVIVVVEPETGRPLLESIRDGRPVRADGPESVMGRLDCKEPSHLALGALARTADLFVTVTDHEAEEAASLLRSHGLATTPSGAAGVAAARFRSDLGLGGESRVLTIVSERAGS